MEHTVERFLQEQQLLQGCRQVTVALSGGADSMALLTVLLSLQDRLGITVSAAHFNHGLRGEETERDEAFVRAWCAQNKVALTVGRGDVRQRAAQTGESVEEAARALRYAFFDTLGTDAVATAHTANDNAETLLLHLLRGTGPRGLCGIPVRRGRYIRPLLTVSRAELLQYLAARDIPHMEDSTNAEDGCVRNRIRHRVMPELLRDNPQFLSAVRRTAQLQTQEEQLLSELAAQAAEDCRQAEGFDCRKLQALHPVLLRRVLLGELRGLQLENPAACYIDALVQLVQAKKPSASVSLPQGLRAMREYDRLVIAKPMADSFPSVTLSIPSCTEIPALGLSVHCFFTKNSNNYEKKPETICLKCDMIAQIVTLRPRQSGDTITLSGGTKTLKKLMIDCKIPARKRGLLPVVELNGRVAAVAQLGIDRAFLPQAGQPCLVIELKRRNENGTDRNAPGC